MKAFACCLLALTSLPAIAQISAQMPAQMPMDRPMQLTDAAAPEKLGTVSFPVSCLPTVQAPFNRGVALLHDFWYEEAQRQFEAIEKADPGCAMAHWGVAMSQFHQIWSRPDEETSKLIWKQLEKAQSPAAKTPREREYIAGLSVFFKPTKQEYQARIEAYSAAMATLYSHYPDDGDAGAFYALSVLAAASPTDTSQTAEHKAMAVLTPLFAKYPDNPGVVHYIIHSCDNPAMAAEGLAAADHYGEIAPSGAHAYHMPGHIYARLGMWPQDITSQLGSIAASEAAEKKYGSGTIDEPHSYDFVLYAYLQSGQDARAQWALDQSSGVLDKIASMPMSGHRMEGMVPYYRAKYAVFYALETRDWKSASRLEPAAGSPPEIATLAVWARTIGDGRLHNASQASADLARHDDLIAEVKKGKNAYMAEGTGSKITRDEMMAWVDFAKGTQDGALQHMREAADLQDKVGQGEVDIPAREMLADMLLEYHQPQRALAEYEVALKLSPNRFNGLYNAGLAAEAGGDKAKAQQYYAALLKSTDNGAQSSRPELAHVKSFVSSTQLAAK